MVGHCGYSIFDAQTMVGKQKKGARAETPRIRLRGFGFLLSLQLCSRATRFGRQCVIPSSLYSTYTVSRSSHHCMTSGVSPHACELPIVGSVRTYVRTYIRRMEHSFALRTSDGRSLFQSATSGTPSQVVELCRLFGRRQSNFSSHSYV